MRLVAVALAILLLATMPTAPATSDGVTDYYVEVDGALAHGLIARPEGAPTAIVVVARGYTHQAESHRAHLAEIAAHGAVGVAMDLGPVQAFPLASGAADTMAATRDLMAQYPDVDRIILYSVSMGAAVAGMVLAEMPNVFGEWVNNEGLAMLHETWAGATALSPSGNPTAVNAVSHIEAETGGTPAEVPQAYLDRSAVYLASQFQGLHAVYITHGLHDGLVPYNQGREMAAALRAQGILSDYYTVVRGEPGGEGTTLTGYTGNQVDGLAGHGTESNDAHTLTALSFNLLYALLDDTLSPAADREIVVDRELGTLP